MLRSIVLLVGGLASLSTVSLFAQDAVLTQEYGSGVHAYFTGDSLKAYERLTAAIQGGSKDPRAFYFRGLAYLKLGRAEEATMDFRKGADLESKDINRFYNVGKALERVQGSERLELETYRVDARMAALEQLEKLRKARYEAVQREEARVLREQAVAAPAGAEVIVPPNAEESSNPFAAAETGAPPEKKPAATPAAAEKKGGDENPFDQAEKPAAKTPAKKGASIDAVGKAIGNAAAGKKPPAAEKKPAVEKKAGDDTDPFGPESGTEKKPVEKKKSTEKATPAKPAEKGADSADPFDK